MVSIHPITFGPADLFFARLGLAGRRIEASSREKRFISETKYSARIAGLAASWALNCSRG